MQQTNISNQAVTSPKGDDHFLDHLTELRTRLIYSFCFILGGGLTCWYFSQQLFDWIRAPIEPYLETDSGGLVYTGVMDQFLAHVKVSFLGGVIFFVPFLVVSSMALY